MGCSSSKSCEADPCDLQDFFQSSSSGLESDSGVDYTKDGRAAHIRYAAANSQNIDTNPYEWNTWEIICVTVLRDLNANKIEDVFAFMKWSPWFKARMAGRDLSQFMETYNHYRSIPHRVYLKTIDPHCDDANISLMRERYKREFNSWRDPRRYPREAWDGPGALQTHTW